MFRVTICDDVELNTDIIYEFIRKYAKERHLNTLIEVFTNPIEVLNDCCPSDVYVLDMIMPHLNGKDLAIRIRENYPDAQFVFIASDKQYAFDSYEVNAKAYLLKPVEYTNLARVLDKIVKEIQQKAFIVHTNNGDRRIYYDDLLYANCVNRALEYHLANGEIIRTVCVRGKIIDALGESIYHDGYMFMAPALLVNLTQIELVDKEYIEFRKHERLYYTQKYYKELRKRWKEIIEE